MASRTAPDSLLLVQDLVNTLDIETGADTLCAAGGSRAFLRDHGFPELALENDELTSLQQLREALRAACLAHTTRTPLPAPAAHTLNRLLAEAPLVLAVGADGRPALRPADGLQGAAQLTAHLAAAMATAVADNTWPRLKACEAHDCRWAFYDRSPAARGRWCDMAICGSRAKMRTYRAKRA
ncbi:MULTISPECIES: CGNR zinc finger domain-containing protein [Streptomyces]|uniref:CGNR zinc finger domain-containing protein n=1 Tax=Streptomyces siderophoricus TaxID=2802281 RepID=A0ABS1MRR1_9ACTN|nr:CGNR zinc finger domain-containing protein [Streptomyces sp. 9-7]MBL1090442.1 CGNR zinc finger domain-containing protein [Streptomyces sp. 9-7]